jgi:signal transduction histidine kinase
MAVAMAATVAAALLVHAVFLALIAQRYLQSEIEAKGRDYAVLTVRELCEGYDVYQESGVFQFRKVVRKVLAGNRDVVALKILSGSGAILFDSASLETDSTDLASRTRTAEEPADPWVTEAASEVVPSERKRLSEGEVVLDVVVPYVQSWGQHRLSVAYSIGYGSLSRRTREVRWVFGLLGAVAVLVSTAIGFLLSQRIVKPLQQLTSHVEDLTRGEFEKSVAVPPGAATEIHILATAFDTMARDLRSYIQSVAVSYASLDKVNAELEAQNAELERFAYTVSHDLKSPLITIRSYADSIVKDAGAGRLDRLGRDASRIIEASGRMRRLLDDVLGLSRVGRVANPSEEVALADLAREAAEIVKGRLDARRVELVIDPELPTVRADRARLLEVLQNLLDNAAKFMGQQEAPRIDVGWRRGREPVYYVRDNGVGIDPRYHQKVFGLFEKLDAASGGTGVGLALAKRIIEVHGGRIWVESEGADRGTAFCFTLGPRHDS